MAKTLSVPAALASADKLVRRGKIAEARAIYLKVREAYPGNFHAARALADLGKVSPGDSPAEIADVKALDDLRVAENHDAVLELGARLRKRHPKNPVILNLIGIAYSKQENRLEAVRHFEDSLKLKPDYAEAWFNLGSELRSLGRPMDASEIFARGLEIKPDSASGHLGMGKALQSADLSDRAEGHYRSAIRSNPKLADAHCGLASTLISLGRMDEARDCIDRALELRPEFARAHELRSRLTRYTEGDPHIAELEAHLETDRQNPRGTALLHVALGKAYGDVGNFANSFSHISESNRLRKEEIGYSIDEDRRLFAQIRATFANTPLPELPEQSGAAPPVPIFILGMPRSGTTLTEQILAGHSRVQPEGELPFFARTIRAESRRLQQGEHLDLTPDLAGKIRSHYLAQLATLRPKLPFFTDKMPANSTWVGFIRMAFPEAKIINTIRDPLAVCWSNFKLYFGADALGFANDLSDVGTYYGLNRDLMLFWRDLFPDAIYPLDYEALTEDPETEARKLFAFCGLDWEPEAIDIQKTKRVVRTHSAMQVREKIYTGSSAAWRKYQAHLGPLVRALEDAGVPDLPDLS